MEQTKKWWQSRTIWSALATAVFGIMSAAGILPASIDSTMINEIVVGLLGAATVYYRTKAEKKIIPILPITETK